MYRALHGKLTVARLVQKSPVFMEHYGTMPSSQKPTSEHYIEPDESRKLHPLAPYCIQFPYDFRSSKWDYPIRFSNQISAIYFSPLRPTYSSQLIVPEFVTWQRAHIIKLLTNFSSFLPFYIFKCFITPICNTEIYVLL